MLERLKEVIGNAKSILGKGQQQDFLETLEDLTVTGSKESDYSTAALMELWERITFYLQCVRRILFINSKILSKRVGDPIKFQKNGKLHVRVTYEIAEDDYEKLNQSIISEE